MSSPFEKLADQSKISEQSITEKLIAGHKTPAKFSMENIKIWMEKGKNTKKSSICALLIGHPKNGKSGIVLDSRSDDEIKDGKKIVIFEFNSDQGADINKAIFHPNDESIIILNPREYKQDTDGIWQMDYIATMSKIKSGIQMLKEDINNGENIKMIAFDGIDIFLSEICENQVRLEENVDAAGGLSMRFWKNRNKYYYDVINMLLDIDCDKYFISHYTPRSRDDKTGMYNDKRTVSKLDETLVYGCQKSTTDKMHQVIEFRDLTRIIAGKKHIKIVATIVADRRSLNTYMNERVIAETNKDGKVEWFGQCLLEKF